MDVQAYIQSGILEAYCLAQLNAEEEAYLIQMSMLYPEVKQELTAVELTFEKIALAAAVQPGPALKKRILSALELNSQIQFDINDLPAIDQSSDHRVWLNTLDHLIPADPKEDFNVRIIRKDRHYQQMLVVSKINVPEETHGGYRESFFILKGRCECTIGSNHYQLGPGDFIEIPSYIKHDVKILTPHVVAVLQYQFQ